MAAVTKDRIHRAVLGLLSAIACQASTGAAVEIESSPYAAGRCTNAAHNSPVDIHWTALYLADFAVGGAIENAYSECACGRLCGGDTDCAEHKAIDQEVDDDHRTSSEATEESPNADETVWARSQGQQFRVPKVASRSGGAAAEILKLRRTVGLNPIAGTIFDQDGDAESWTRDDVGTQRDASSEDAIVEVIGRLEAEQQAIETPLPGFNGWPAFSPQVRKAQVLRPAERKLEEAAELLEQLGQFDRADSARALAQDVREEARKCERQSQNFQFGPISIVR